MLNHTNTPARWVLASGNKGKLKEFSDLFAPMGIDWVPQGDLGVPEVEEPFHTFIENALAKARHASQHTGLPALADDSGLCVPALMGAPGVKSARYATLFGREKSDANNNAALIEQLQNLERGATSPQANSRRAYFVCAMVWVSHADDPTPTVAQKMWFGEVLDAPRGEHGFGYDPHFWVPQYQQTAAEMPRDLKNQISHRAQATQALLTELRGRLNLQGDKSQ
ncbi:MAG: RdgB/HAM1 family non-canonical purine NTP pyrophosphatase [Limnobacter sp.]|nr:RdgB/HAM1 family non-canonical purine NTP pyrophosphatase [Limnobacter sp.]